MYNLCSGVKVSLRAVSATFECKKCRGDVPPAEVAAEGFKVDGETYAAVDRFCYLGDMLNAQGGGEAAVTVRVRCAWQKFRELSSFLTS